MWKWKSSRGGDDPQAAASAAQQQQQQQQQLGDSSSSTHSSPSSAALRQSSLGSGTGAGAGAAGGGALPYNSARLSLGGTTTSTTGTGGTNFNSRGASHERSGAGGRNHGGGGGARSSSTGVSSTSVASADSGGSVRSLASRGGGDRDRDRGDRQQQQHRQGGGGGGGGGGGERGVLARGVSSRGSGSDLSQSQPGWMNTFTSRVGAVGGSFMQDAEMERRAARAARSLGKEVQNVVRAVSESQRGSASGGAGGGVGDEWKIRLLDLLGGEGPEGQTSYIDVLLANSGCSKFVQKCVENDLPPNLIHCLRLLRVLELQHSTGAGAVYGGGGSSSESAAISTVAAGKVSRLLALLCTDPVVGEQLRPHLFGLLKLCAASYPPAGVHIASAASAVVVALSDNCLSPSLVWFLHDKRMIVHMTDDIKELCGMSSVSAASAASSSLYGPAAEEAGLWVVALRTVVAAVTRSCSPRYRCVELLKDFDDSGGYHVLSYAILNSTRRHVTKLLELLVMLVCCETTAADGGEGGASVGFPTDGEGGEGGDDDNNGGGRKHEPPSPADEPQLATNMAALEIIGDLMVQSVPFLCAYVDANGGQRPILSTESLKELARFSVNSAVAAGGTAAGEGGFGGGGPGGGGGGGEGQAAAQQGGGLASELLVITLQLYSDHPKNYGMIECRYHFLSLYLLAFPTLGDESVKVLTLKTLEYVCTGLVGSDSITPISVANEVLLAIFSFLFENYRTGGAAADPSSPSSSGGGGGAADGGGGGEGDRVERRRAVRETLLQDAQMLCDTMEKLIQFDGSMSDVISGYGLLDERISRFLSRAADVASGKGGIVGGGDGGGGDDGENGGAVIPAAAAAAAAASAAAAAAAAAAAGEGEGPDPPPSSTDIDAAYSNVCRFLKLMVCTDQSLSGTAAMGGGGMGHAGGGLTGGAGSGDDEIFRRLDLNPFLSTAIRGLGEPASRAALSVFEAVMCVGARDNVREEMACVVALLSRFLDDRHVNTVQRVTAVVQMLRVVMETNDHANDAFRTSGGFEILVRLLFGLDSFVPEGGSRSSKEDKALIALVETCFSVVAASTRPPLNERQQKNQQQQLQQWSEMNDGTTPPRNDDGSQREPSWIVNRRYLRRAGFYKEFASATASTGILQSTRRASSILNLSLALLDPTLPVLKEAPEAKIINSTLPNADATRLVLGIALHLPPRLVDSGKKALDEILRLCAPDKAASTLSTMSSCAIIGSLTSPSEFGSQLEDRSHPLYSRCMLLLRRVAAFSMTYTDFVSLLRFMAGPILRVDDGPGPGGVGGQDGPGHLAHQQKKGIQLPVISSTLHGPLEGNRRKGGVDGGDPSSGSSPMSSLSSNPHNLSPDRRAREADFCTRLETLSIIAERGDRVSRCILGGDSLNTVALYMQKVSVDERLYRLAGEGRLRFIEIAQVDSSATNDPTLDAGGAASATPVEKIWAPFSSSGFSYSVWIRLPDSVGGVGVGEAGAGASSGSLFLLDVSCGGGVFLSFWFDLQHQQVCILSSASSRNEPARFPPTPLAPSVWHNLLFTYQLPKRPVLMRKAVATMYIDGRLVECELKVDNLNMLPTARVHIGAPCPKLAASGIVRGPLPVWEMGPCLMVSRVLESKDATAIYASGPEYEGLFWGDRPQRLSFTASATAAFAMLADSGEEGSVACALRRRRVPEVEAAGHVMRERGSHDDSLAAVGLLCSVSAEDVVFGLHASASSAAAPGVGSSSGANRSFNVGGTRLVNIGRQSTFENVASDAFLYGGLCVVSPHSFADNLQWVGGPNVLLPLVNDARTPASLSLSLRLIRAAVDRHPPNLENLQSGGGYRILGLLLRQKRIMTTAVLDQCFAFAVHGFVPGSVDRNDSGRRIGQQQGGQDLTATSEHWVFTDLDAMKYLLLNHQIWDLRGCGPDLPMRLLTFLNGLVAVNNIHAAFNARRLHLLGIVQWVLHLMLEAAVLFSSDDGGGADGAADDGGAGASLGSGSTRWRVDPPSISTTAVGGDPDNELLLGCKTLLRRVLTYMLTPGDLDAAAGAAIYTLSVSDIQGNEVGGPDADILPPGAVARVYILRLLEELVVDGVNEIVMANRGADGAGPDDGDAHRAIQPHAGGGTSMNQSYLFSRKKRQAASPQGGGADGDQASHPSHQQAQAFLSAFSGILTPNWFACILEGCREEASASAAFRLMILLLQSSPTFATAFEEAGGFAPLVLSIPKFSVCPSIVMSMLSQLLHAPILHLPCFAALDAGQLCEVFDAEVDPDLCIVDSTQGGLHMPSDPSCGIFALLSECLGRNIQLATLPSDLGAKAQGTNEAVLSLLRHQHTFSSSFQEFCRTRDFLEPLAQALCLVHQERPDDQQSAMGEDGEVRMARGEPRSSSLNPYGQVRDEGFSQEDSFMAWSSTNSDLMSSRRDERAAGGVDVRTLRRGSLCQVDFSKTPTERFVERNFESERCGIGMVELLQVIVSHAVLSGPLAASLISALFHSFPIHATPDQVEAFHLLLIEHCRDVIEDALQRGEAFALANCVGVSSVFLDRLMAGFFTSEPVLEAVRMVLGTLGSLTANGSYASRTLKHPEHNMLIADAAHIARLTCVTALIRSRPRGPYDRGDDDLKLKVLEAIGRNLEQLLLAPTVVNSNLAPLSVLGSSGAPLSPYNPPAVGSRSYSLWQSCSLARCPSTPVLCSYPDLRTTELPDRAFVISIMAELHLCLLDRLRSDVREHGAYLVVCLIQQCPNFMSELLIKEIPHGDRTETVDLMNRGGFGALVAEHAKQGLDGRSGGRRGMDNGTTGAGKVQYATFFDWLGRNETQVAAVFHGIHLQASRQLNGAEGIASTPEEAIEKEQKVMLLKLTSQDSSDRTILGGLERAELAQHIHEQMAESHDLWKRQGFDDIASGTTQWKVLLRQLKGPLSIWEGGSSDAMTASPFSRERLLRREFLVGAVKSEQMLEEYSSNSTLDGPAGDLTRWKLDLTEGYERQRRRLLPNHEFHGLYNIDDGMDSSGRAGANATDENAEEEEKSTFSAQMSFPSLVNAESVDATAALLKEMHIKTKNIYEEEEDDKQVDEDAFNLDAASGELKKGDAPNATSNVLLKTARDASDQSPSDASVSEAVPDANNDETRNNDDTANEEEQNEDENEKRNGTSASSYDLITGLLEPGDWPEKSYNVQRCTGLEVRKALLLWCRGAIYIVDGFEQTEGDGLEGKINRLEMSTSTYKVNIRSKISSEEGEEDAGGDAGHRGTESSPRGNTKGNKKSSTVAEGEITYQHRSQRISFNDLFSVYKRRYQLQPIALEFYDVHRNGILVAFMSTAERDEVLSKALASPLPNSIFTTSGLGAGSVINYDRFMASLRAKITSQWVNGRMSNFEFIMHLNSFAGRSYNDLTQYPVFPWILSDYESEAIDLRDPRVYRDLSKPMGAQGEGRARVFRERFEYLEENAEMNPDEPPAFHYGTHYSCAAYVLYYLMRLEPFSRLALALQGGNFDEADRLFQNINSSWFSASRDNTQDVRELIPEFFYLPEFLVNSNMFDYGKTQQGHVVHDVTLPPWAKGDTKRFVRINRQALESEYVSKHLHLWIDLIFGYKQWGKEAVKAQNTFVHLTYEGAVDLDAITDPVEKEAKIAQIQNFGQTPSRLERRPFPQRNIFVVAKEKAIDFSALQSLAFLTPPFCIVGAPHRVHLNVTLWDTCRIGMFGQTDSSVGDMCLVKGQIIGVGRSCALIMPHKTYYRFGGANNGVSVHVAIPTARNREVNRVISIHDGLHRSPISMVKASLNGNWLVTGCADSTVRVWRSYGKHLHLQATLCGHEGGEVTSIDVSTTFGTIVTGGADGNVLVWDLRRLTFLRQLSGDQKIKDESWETPRVASVSINHKNGNVLTLVGSRLRLFDINGNLLAVQDPKHLFSTQGSPTCAVATNCPEWMEHGVVAVSGHRNGDVLLWSINDDRKLLELRHVVPDKVHSCGITALRIAGERQDTLLVGDQSGKMSVCKTLRLDCLNAQELAVILRELKTAESRVDPEHADKTRLTSNDMTRGWGI